jgi:hypothetical protein
VLAAACHDGGLPTDATGPDRVVVGATPLDALTRVYVLQRTSPLERDITASARIGALGGTIVLPDRSVRLTIPRGALRTTTEIRVTAVAGSDVALEFEPHGLRFDRPVTVSVSLAGTRAEDNLLVAATLFAAYVPDGRAGLLPDGTALISEALRMALGLGRQARFDVNHFSGYILATGRAGR